MHQCKRSPIHECVIIEEWHWNDTVYHDHTGYQVSCSCGWQPYFNALWADFNNAYNCWQKYHILNLDPAYY